MILLDTHTLIWSELQPKLLSRAAASAIRRAKKSGGLAISAISLWEMAALLERGKIRALGTVEASVRRLAEGVVVQPITLEIGVLAAQFPSGYPGDPADRIIGATAKVLGIALVTKDERLHRFLETVW